MPRGSGGRAGAAPEVFILARQPAPAPQPSGGGSYSLYRAYLGQPQKPMQTVGGLPALGRNLKLWALDGRQVLATAAANGDCYFWDLARPRFYPPFQPGAHAWSLAARGPLVVYDEGGTLRAAILVLDPQPRLVVVDVASGPGRRPNHRCIARALDPLEVPAAT